MYGQQHAFLDPRGKSDFDAGLIFFGLVSRLYPGITWAQLQQPQFLAGWWTDLKHAAGDVVDGTGDILKSTVGVIGKIGGDTVRLASDPQVSQTVSRAATAYATGGASEGAKGIFDSIGQIFTTEGQQVVTAAGQQYKASVGGFDWRNPWVLGLGALGVVGVVLLARRPQAVYR